MKKNVSQEHNNSSSGMGITLWDVLSICFHRITILIVFTLLLAALAASYAYHLFLDKTSTKISVLNFSLTFEGVANGKYPNGTKFVETDIIASPILRAVYSNNNLESYFGSFENFKNTISIERYNPGLAFLNSEYKAKLANRSLSSAERYEIEQEFYRQTANIVSKPIFSLVSIYPGGGTKYNVPDVIISKILNDILSTWLEKAKSFQGVTRYNISLLSNRVDDEFIEEVDFFSGADFMRLLLNALIDDLSKVEKLPNTKLFKITFKNQTYTLQDISLKIKYIRNYILTPLLELIRATNAYKDKQKTLVYLESQLNNLNLKQEILLEKKENYENMLLEHYIANPKPIVELSGEIIKLNSEISFYKKFYNTVMSSTPKLTEEQFNQIKRYQVRLLQSENLIMDLIYKFYEKANQYNLDSNASFYRINWFSSYISGRVNQKLIIKKVAVYWAIAELVLIFLVVVISLIKKKETEGHHNDDSAQEIRVYTQIKALPEKSETVERIKKIPK